MIYISNISQNKQIYLIDNLRVLKSELAELVSLMSIAILSFECRYIFETCPFSLDSVSIKFPRTAPHNKNMCQQKVYI